jgi:WD40 repeat protein
LDRVVALAFSHNGRLIASASADGMISLWSADNGDCLWESERLGEGVWHMTLSADDSILYVTRDMKLHMWDPRSDLCQKVNLLKLELTDVIYSAALLSSGHIALGMGDGDIGIWEPETGNRFKVLTGHTGSVVSFACSPDGKLISGSKDGTFKVWDLA